MNTAGNWTNDQRIQHSHYLLLLLLLLLLLYSATQETHKHLVTYVWGDVARQNYDDCQLLTYNLIVTTQ